MAQAQEHSLTIHEFNVVPDFDFPSFTLLRGEYPPLTETNPKLAYMHFHNLMEVGICLVGSGTAFVEDRDTPYRAGDVVFIPSYVSHCLRDDPPGDGPAADWEYFYFDLDTFLHPLFPEGFPLRQLFMINSPLVQNVCSPDAQPEIVEDVKAILDEMRLKRPNYRLSVRLMTSKLLIDLSRCVPQAEAAMTPPCKLSVMPAIIYIRNHYNEELYVEQLAAMCFMSPASFRRKFKEATGHTALETVNNYRILKACEYLSHSDMSIVEIAARVGFDSVSGFGRRFADIMGITPLKWKNNTVGRRRR